MLQVSRRTTRRELRGSCVQPGPQLVEERTIPWQGWPQGPPTGYSSVLKYRIERDFSRKEHARYSAGQILHLLGRYWAAEGRYKEWASTGLKPIQEAVTWWMLPAPKLCPCLSDTCPPTIFLPNMIPSRTDRCSPTSLSSRRRKTEQTLKDRISLWVWFHVSLLHCRMVLCPKSMTVHLIFGETVTSWVCLSTDHSRLTTKIVLFLLILQSAVGHLRADSR